jgi:hypothetical protein
MTWREIYYWPYVLMNVVSPTLPCAGMSEEVPLDFDDFVGSVERLTWARKNGCPWNSRTYPGGCVATCAHVARGEAVQVEPMKLILKAPGTNSLKPH